MDQFDRLPYLFVGWLMGLLAPAIVDRIRRNYRAAELMEAVVIELRELQYTMALVSFTVRKRLAWMPDEWLAWFEPTVRSYVGPEVSPAFLESVAKLRKASDEDRRLALARNFDPMRGLGLKEYAIPFLAAHAGDISIFPMAFQPAG